jgi:hypothetical protein
MQNKALYTVIGILVALLGWLGSVQFQKLTEIEKSLIELKLEVTKVQMSIVDEEAVRKIVETELLRHGIK